MRQYQNRCFLKQPVTGPVRKHAGGALFLLGCLVILTVYSFRAEWPLWPSAPAVSVLEDGALHVDASNLSEGYFTAWSLENSEHRLKMRVEKEETSLTYDLGSAGEEDTFPLQLGDGEYQVTMYENVGGKKYAQAGHVSLTVQLSDPLSPYLYTNQYVKYQPDSPVMEAAAQLSGAAAGRELYDAVCDFMRSGFAYDYVRAITVEPGALPDIDNCYMTKAGICQDLSAVAVCLLRYGGVPAKLVIGYADDNYHAWVLAYPEGEEVFFDPTAELDAIAAPGDYAVERWY